VGVFIAADLDAFLRARVYCYRTTLKYRAHSNDVGNYRDANNSNSLKKIKDLKVLKIITKGEQYFCWSSYSMIINSRIIFEIRIAVVQLLMCLIFHLNVDSFKVL